MARQLTESRKDVGETSEAAQSSRKEGVRGGLAYIYVAGFLLIIAAALVIAFVENLKVDEASDLLIALSSVLAGPLGFIIGYYFKEGQEK